MSLRQQLDEHARAENEVDHRLGEVTARVQGLREQVRERNELCLYRLHDWFFNRRDID